MPQGSSKVLTSQSPRGLLPGGDDPPPEPGRVTGPGERLRPGQRRCGLRHGHHRRRPGRTSTCQARANEQRRFGPKSQAMAGDVLTLQITIHNSGNAPATNVPSRTTSHRCSRTPPTTMTAATAAARSAASCTGPSRRSTPAARRCSPSPRASTTRFRSGSRTCQTSSSSPVRAAIAPPRARTPIATPTRRSRRPPSRSPRRSREHGRN